MTPTVTTFGTYMENIHDETENSHEQKKKSSFIKELNSIVKKASVSRKASVTEL